MRALHYHDNYYHYVIFFVDNYRDSDISTIAQP